MLKCQVIQWHQMALSTLQPLQSHSRFVPVHMYSQQAAKYLKDIIYDVTVVYVNGCKTEKNNRLFWKAYPADITLGVAHSWLHLTAL